MKISKEEMPYSLPTYKLESLSGSETASPLRYSEGNQWDYHNLELQLKYHRGRLRTVRGTARRAIVFIFLAACNKLESTVVSTNNQGH